jgi:hypothetical protein
VIPIQNVIILSYKMSETAFRVLAELHPEVLTASSEQVDLVIKAMKGKAAQIVDNMLEEMSAMPERASAAYYKAVMGLAEEGAKALTKTEH